MPDFDLSVTICSWNTEDDLRVCLASLERVRDEAVFEVLVVDNNSEDGSPDMVEREFPWVRLFRMDRNLGFTGGQNLAMAERKGRHAFLLNSDAEVHPGALRTLLGYCEAHPEAGILGPKILNPDGSLQLSCRRFPNPVAALFRNTLIGRWFPNNRFTREYLMADWAHETPREVDWVSGAALFASGELIDAIGTFDPEYYMFCEDVDWCFRAWKHGWKVVYVPDAVVTHAIGRSTDKAPNRMIGRFHRSMLRFYTKNMLPTIVLPLRPFAWLGAAIALAARAGSFIVKNKIDEIRRRRA
ncbi:MAG: glycosyltransferase family 2 protein [Fimbriimonadaceae bacterium]|nr:glycosyltransferase family 2 protein [Fimbriimonadaceae bacterium]